MCFTKSSHIFYLLLCSALLQNVVGDDPIGHHCSGDNIQHNAVFQFNLAKLISSLSQSATSTGFSRDSVGDMSDMVHGLALCLGNVIQQDCNACLVEAGNEIRGICSTKSGIIWYDYCMLKYSSNEFLGKIDMKNHIRECNKKWQPIAYRVARRRLFRTLTKEASRTPNLSAYGDRRQGLTGKQGKVYGMVQCTRDLSGSDCYKCLRRANIRFRSICASRDGGGTFSGSCFIRFETHPF